MPEHARGYTVGRYVCTVNQVGPASDGTETPAPVVYINLTDTAGSFENFWFYAANGIQQQLLDVGIAAITHGKDVAVAATAPEPGNSQFTEVSRLFGFVAPVPPVAPIDFHEISLSPPTATNESGLLVVGWRGNFDNKISFAINWQSQDGTSGSQSAGPNSATASVSLTAGFTYDLYVAAVNSAGESAPSNTITVTIPYVQPTPTSATLLAVVEALQGNISNFGLLIEGRNFGANETVVVTVEWTVTGESPPVPTILGPLSTDSIGFFQVWFTGGSPDGLCPIGVAFGQPQPPQYFSVSAHGQSSGETASTSAGPFTCPFGDPGSSGVNQE
jgi:hypothetical protein